MSKYIKEGLFLMIISLLVRILSFFVLKTTGMTLFIRNFKYDVINIMLCILFFSIWIIYSYWRKLGLKGGIITGIVGCLDGLILMAMGMILFWGYGLMGNEVQLWILWITPLFSMVTALEKGGISLHITYLIPVLTVGLSALGGFLGAKIPKLKSIIIKKVYEEPELSIDGVDEFSNDSYETKCNRDNRENYYSISDQKGNIVGYFNYDTYREQVNFDIESFYRKEGRSKWIMDEVSSFIEFKYGSKEIKEYNICMVTEEEQ